MTEGGDVLEEMFELHYERLVRFAFLLSGGRDAEDLAQDAFVRALRKWKPGAPTEAFWSWAQTTIVRLHLNGLRRARREAAAYIRHGARETEDPPASTADVVRALAELPPRQRVAVVLRYFTDLPEAEIAEKMSCRPGTVKALLHQARTRLQTDGLVATGSFASEGI